MNIVLHICKDMETTQIAYENIGRKIGRNSQFSNNRQIIDYDLDEIHVFTNPLILKYDLIGRAIVEYHLHDCELNDLLKLEVESHLVRV